MDQRAGAAGARRVANHHEEQVPEAMRQLEIVVLGPVRARHRVQRSTVGRVLLVRWQQIGAKVVGCRLRIVQNVCAGSLDDIEADQETQRNFLVVLVSHDRHTVGSIAAGEEHQGRVWVARGKRKVIEPLPDFDKYVQDMERKVEEKFNEEG